MVVDDFKVNAKDMTLAKSFPNICLGIPGPPLLRHPIGVQVTDWFGFVISDSCQLYAHILCYSAFPYD